MRLSRTLRWAATTATVLLAASLAAPAAAQSMGRSLDIQPGARQNAMGAAGVALTADPGDAAWWNPAALGFAGTFGVRWTTSRLVPDLASDVWYNHAVVAFPIRGFGGIGIGGTRVSYSSSEATDEWGSATGTFGTHETSGSISAGYHALPELALGVTAKYLRIQFAPGSRSGVANAVGFDFGGLYRRSADPATFSVGFNLQNVGPKVSFVNWDRARPLSRNLKLGAAIECPLPPGYGDYELGAIAACDFNQSLVTGDFRTWNAGVEVYGGYATARLMVRGGYYKDALDGIRDFTFGGGLHLHRATFDMAWIPQATGLDHVLKMTLGLHSELQPSWQ